MSYYRRAKVLKYGCTVVEKYQPGAKNKNFKKSALAEADLKKGDNYNGR